MPERSSLSGIQIFNQTRIHIPLSKDEISAIAQTVAEGENVKLSFLEVVYVDEEEIVRINREYLEHDYVTDILTFSYDEEHATQSFEGTLFCCAPRIYEQAEELNLEAKQEFRRIIIHGLLHLCGYNDKSDKERQQMSSREDYYLGKIG